MTKKEKALLTIAALKAENEAECIAKNALTKQRDRVFDDLISLKLDIWAEHMARETGECPHFKVCDLMTKDSPSFEEAKEMYCVPCWQRFAHGEE